MLRILIVEDNPIFREEFKKRLAEHFPAAALDEAQNGDEALRRIGQAPPDLVFMDIRLSGANGLQLTMKIKKERPNIRVAIPTAYDFPECRRAADQYGADRFFVKDSFDWNELAEYVQSTSKEVS